MFELTPYLMLVFIAIVATRACAVVAARRVSSKRPAEGLLASLVIVPVLEPSFLLDGARACYSVLKESGLRGWPGRFALVHLVAWAVFVSIILVMIVAGLIRYFGLGL